MGKNKGKEIILKSTRKNSYDKGISIRLSAGFSAETLQAKREWHDIFKVLKGKKLKEFISTKVTLQKMLRGLLQVKKKGPQQEIRKYRKGKTPLLKASKGSGSTT